VKRRRDFGVRADSSPKDDVHKRDLVEAPNRVRAQFSAMIGATGGGLVVDMRPKERARRATDLADAAMT